MKAMILAAGRGERMRPLSDTIPKVLLPVNGYSLIEHHILRLAQAGVKEVVINLHYLPEKIQQHVGDGSRYGVAIHYEVERVCLNTGGGVLNCLSHLGKEPFILVAGDIFAEFDYTALPAQLTGLLHLVMVDNPSHHPQGDYALDEHGHVLLTGNKLNYGGIALIHPKLFALANNQEAIFPIATLFKLAIERGLATGQYYAGRWCNVGTPQQYVEIGGSF